MKKRIIIKLDDFRFNTDPTKFLVLVNQFRGKAKLNIGYIGSALTPYRDKDINLVCDAIASGEVEFWNHSHNHKNLTQLSDSDILREVSESAAKWKQIIGVDPVGFGAPYNKISEDNVKCILNEHDIFIYENDFKDWTLITPEYNVPFDGQPNSKEFESRLKAYDYPDQIIVQAHPGRWLPHAFEEFELCIQRLIQLGYESVLASSVSKKCNKITSDINCLKYRHIDTNTKNNFNETLANFWANDVEKYNSKLSNFKSYFLSRFQINYPDIQKLLTLLDVDVSPVTVVDVGSGLAQWSLPFTLSSRVENVYAYDTNEVIASALSDAVKCEVINKKFKVKCVDFTTDSSLSEASVDLILCANALNYIPLEAFVKKSVEVLKFGSSLLLLNQTSSFNLIGFYDSIQGSNAGLTKERILSELKQRAVRHGFRALVPQRTTYLTAELEAVLISYGFVLSDQFCPKWERLYKHTNTFQGSLFKFYGKSYFDIRKVKNPYRSKMVKNILQAGQHSIYESVVDDHLIDLVDYDLALLYQRGGRLMFDAANREYILGDLLLNKSYKEALGLIGGVSENSFAWCLVGFLLSVEIGDEGLSQLYIDNLLGLSEVGDDTAVLANVYYCLLKGKNDEAVKLMEKTVAPKDDLLSIQF